MTYQLDNKEIADLRRVNADLTRSLERCREIVSDCRNKLAANANEDESRGGDDEFEDRAVG